MTPRGRDNHDSREYSKRRVAALVKVAWMVTAGGLYARNLEFPDFSARYDAQGSIAGHRRGVRMRTVSIVLGDAVHGAGNQGGLGSAAKPRPMTGTRWR
jgi:hypothetical protein